MDVYSNLRIVAEVLRYWTQTLLNKINEAKIVAVIMDCPRGIFVSNIIYLDEN